MPEISRFYGIIIYMYMNEHQPPHFHVWYNDYKAIITIEDGVVTGSLPRRALKLVYEWLDLHKLSCWTIGNEWSKRTNC